jgi:hypothetical protein
MAVGRGGAYEPGATTGALRNHPLHHPVDIILDIAHTTQFPQVPGQPTRPLQAFGIRAAEPGEGTRGRRT